MNLNSFLPDKSGRTFLVAKGYAMVGRNPLWCIVATNNEIRITDEYVLIVMAGMFRHLYEKKNITCIKSYQGLPNSIQIVHTQPKSKKFVVFQREIEAEPELRAVFGQAGYPI